jgi:hypothetical protein
VLDNGGCRQFEQVQRPLLVEKDGIWILAYASVDRGGGDNIAAREGGVDIFSHKDHPHIQRAQEALGVVPAAVYEVIRNVLDCEQQVLGTNEVTLPTWVDDIAPNKLGDELVGAVVAPGVGHLVEIVWRQDENRPRSCIAVEVVCHCCPVLREPDVFGGQRGLWAVDDLAKRKGVTRHYEHHSG